MPEGVTTVDGTPVELDTAQRDFSRAMSAPPPDDGLTAPPKRTPADLEHAAKPAKAKPEAKQAKPRTTKTAPAIKADYTADAQSLITTAWTLTAAIPFTSPYATVINANANQLVSALAEGAKHNDQIRGLLSGTGENSWKVSLTVVALNMAMQTMQLMRDAELRAQAAEQTREQMSALVKSAAPKPEAESDDMG